jgi:thiol-disulfide isomerase/thioredoxin
MKISIIAAALLVAQTSICAAQDKFQISGKMSANGRVVLSYTDENGKDKSDTAVIKQGKFSFAGTTAYGNKSYLSMLPDTGKRRSQDWQEFYLEKGKYTVSGKDSMATAVIKGSQAQKDFAEYNSWMGTKPKEWRQIAQRAQKAMSTKDTAAMTQIRAEAKPLYAAMEATLDSFILTHPASYVALDLIFTEKSSVIDPAVFDKYYSKLTPEVLASFTGKKLTAKYDKARQISIGKTFDFTQQDTSGVDFKLSSLRGKYVLVDFWASWCGPCRAENPNVLSAYNKLKGRNFEVVAISLDDSRRAWLGAVVKDGLPWKQVSDLKGWKNDVAVKYGITAVPQNLLVDPNGVIIAKNLRGEGLYDELDKLLK